MNIIHKGVGAITESDVLLASASDAIVLGFNVRPMGMQDHSRKGRKVSGLILLSTMQSTMSKMPWRECYLPR